MSATRAGTRRTNSVDGGYGMFLLPGLVLFLLVIILPFLVTIGASFTKWNGVTTPRFIGLDNYANAVNDSAFWASFTNNLKLMLAMVVVPTILGLLLAGLLFTLVAPRFGNRWASFFRAGFYLPQVMPVAIAGVVWGWILAPAGALNSVLQAVGLGGLVHDWLGDPGTALLSIMGMMIWFQVGFPLVIFFTALQRTDPILAEAASLDGASPWQSFIHVTLPQIRPEIFVVVLMTTIATLKVFGQVYVLTRGGPGTETLVPSYYVYQNFFQLAKVGYGSAIATIMAAIIIILAAVFISVQSRRDLAEDF
ncbi:MAG TPA: sugar ABC transporter permease [Terriglobales bacterium]|nr:sugar ABC transporter permease [Terriglobales bacterium]